MDMFTYLHQFFVDLNDRMDIFSPDFGDFLRDLMGYNGIQKDIVWEIHSLLWKITILSWVNPIE